MKTFQFPKPYKHEHEPVKNLNDVIREKLTLWVILNILAFVYHWDPYPFILLNLFLSLQAAYTAPVIMMSQNRQAERDRLEAHNDYMINQKAEIEVRLILDHLETQNKALEEIYKTLDEIKNGNVKQSTAN